MISSGVWGWIISTATVNSRIEIILKFPFLYSYLLRVHMSQFKWNYTKYTRQFMSKDMFFLETLIFYASSQSFGGGVKILNSFFTFLKPNLEIVFGRISKWDPNWHGRSSSATRHSEDFQKHHWKSAESLHTVHIQIYTIENQLLAFAPAVPMRFGSLYSLHYNHDICCGGVRLTENFPH